MIEYVSDLLMIGNNSLKQKIKIKIKNHFNWIEHKYHQQ